MKPPNPLSGRRREGGALGEFILLAHYPICVSGTDRIKLGKGNMEPGKVYPIILSVFVGSDRTDFSIWCGGSEGSSPKMFIKTRV